jgi:hypothetical protein
MPFGHDDFGDAVDDPAAAEPERQVRRTAQQVIRSLLTSDGPEYALER